MRGGPLRTEAAGLALVGVWRRQRAEAGKEVEVKPRGLLGCRAGGRAGCCPGQGQKPTGW